jgi:hypothetical protein
LMMVTVLDRLLRTRRRAQWGWSFS